MLSTVQHISKLLRNGGIVCSIKYLLSVFHSLYYIKLLVFKGMNGNAYSAWRWCLANHIQLPVFFQNKNFSTTCPQSSAAEEGQSQIHAKVKPLSQ